MLWGEAVKMWDPATFLSARGTPNSKNQQPLQKELRRQQLVGQKQIQRSEPTHIPAKGDQHTLPLLEKDTGG